MSEECIATLARAINLQHMNTVLLPNNACNHCSQHFLQLTDHDDASWPPVCAGIVDRRDEKGGRSTTGVLQQITVVLRDLGGEFGVQSGKSGRKVASTFRFSPDASVQETKTRLDATFEAN